MASKEALRRTALAALASWPKDPLRPTAQLGDILSARLRATPPQFPGSSSSSPSSPPPPPEKQVNAIQALLANKFSRKYAPDPARSATDGTMMRPASNPGYYDALISDLEAVPTRTWTGKVAIRLKGLLRWS